MRRIWRTGILATALIAFTSPLAGEVRPSLSGARILVYSRTTGFRHESIDAGRAALTALAKSSRFSVTFTEDPGWFTDSSLARYDAVVFLNTTGDVLDDVQQGAFERFIRAGRGLLGIHSATDTERDGAWPWYAALIGARFLSHPAIQEARLITAPGKDAKVGKCRPPFGGLRLDQRFTDEWYDFSDMSPGICPILMIDRGSYSGSTTRGLSPIVWSNAFDGGRAFYIGLGHRQESYRAPLMRSLILDGLDYVVAKSR